jgi:hypothetical protein
MLKLFSKTALHVLPQNYKYVFLSRKKKILIDFINPMRNRGMEVSPGTQVAAPPPPSLRCLCYSLELKEIK